MPDALNQTAKTHSSPLPDIGDIIFLVILQFLVFSMPNFQFGDGSTGWHLFTGDYILTTHTIPHQDIISYTFPGAPWVAYEWLSDLMMASIVKLAGLNGLNVVMGAIIAAVQLLLYERCRKPGCHFLVALPLVVAGALASSLHWLARPLVFTFLGVYIFSTSLQLFHRGDISRRKLLVILTLTMLLWVNLHPAFLLGLGLIGLYLLCELVQVCIAAAGQERNQAAARARTMVLALLTTIAASMLNPCGPQLYRYIAHYLQGSRVLAYTSEYQTPAFGGQAQTLCLELIFFAVLAGLALKKGRCSLPQFLVVAAVGHLALCAVRNIPIFIIVAVPFAADLFTDSQLVPAASSAGWWQDFSGKFKALGDNFDGNERLCNMHLLPVAAVAVLMLIALNGVSPGHPQILCSGFDPRHMPTSTLDYIQKHHLPATRGFNFDNWGGYIRYRLGIPVYIDDRADFYGEGFYVRYGRVSMTQPGWTDVLKQQNIDWVLFPVNSGLSARLKGDPHWKLAAEDEAADLFVRLSAPVRQTKVVPASSVLKSSNQN